MFAFQDKRGAVEVAFTDRFGGTSAGPFAELNLALPRPSRAAHEYDEGEDTVEENWDIVIHALLRGTPPVGEDLFSLAPGVFGQLKQVAGMRQVHGAHVELVEPEPELKPGDEPEADGLVSSASGVVLVARAADCVPVLLADPGRGVVAAVHAGRKGVAGAVVPSALAAMREQGAERVVAWIGPHACGRCYEVPEEMRDEVAALVPETRAVTSWGTPALDLGAGVAAQLRAAVDGLVVTDVLDVGRCTIEDPALYSYRRDREHAGRHAGLIWMRP